MRVRGASPLRRLLIMFRTYARAGRLPASSSVDNVSYVCASPLNGFLPEKIETVSGSTSSFNHTMFTELNYAKTVNRFKANKGIKYRRAEKYVHEKYWKTQKNRAMQVQSRSETEFDEEILQPEKHLSRWEQHNLQHQRQAAYPLGAGW
jgi:hypothetical protein